MNVLKTNKVFLIILIIFSSYFVLIENTSAMSSERYEYLSLENLNNKINKIDSENKSKKEELSTQNKIIDNRIEIIDNRIQIIIIALILSLLMNFILINFYFFIGNKKVNQTIKNLNKFGKNQNAINEINSTSFANLNKHILFLENIQTEIDYINRVINSIQNSSIESPKNKVESLIEKKIKDNNIYELKVDNTKIKEICNNHFKMTNRDFRKKYSQDLKIIEISDDIEKEKPIFETSSTGKYIAIKYENDKYLVFYSKGTNITSENHSVISIFTLDQEIEKDKIYENWKINKPASFLLNNDDTWSIEEKGIINLDFNQEEVESTIIIDFEEKKDVLINDNKNNDKFEQNKTHIELIKEVINNHFNMSYWQFMQEYKNSIRLDITNSDDVVYRNYAPIFNENKKGIYILISFPELINSKHYLFYPKGRDITSEDIALKTVFNFEKEPEKRKLYDSWKIIQPAIFIIDFNNNWQIIKKGKIEL